MKSCKKCKTKKPYTDFYSNGRGTFASNCKVCDKKRAKQWAKDNPYKRKGYLTKTNYGITRKEYDILLQKCQNKCEICGLDSFNFKRALNIDHNHESGKVRGLLCTNCNQGIGHLKDSIDILKKAISYLEKNND